MDDTDALLSIGAFARRVGLAPSALRFYDDCGILRPARVDGSTGYRHYAPEQEPRAVLVRRLREGGLPLTDVSAVLDGTPEEARRLLEGHARAARDRAAAAVAVIEELLRDLGGLRGLRGLPGGTGGTGGAPEPYGDSGAEGEYGCRPTRTVARIGGAELASAVRQVAPAVAGDAAVRAEAPALGCVLLELDGGEVRLVATDRYRLSVRVLRALSAEGGPGHALIGAERMRAVAAWALGRPEVTVEIDGGEVRFRGGDGLRTAPGDGDVTRTVSAVDDVFPDYRLVLNDLPPARHRVITDRGALRAALLGREGTGRVLLTADERQLVLDGPPGGRLSGGRPRTVLPAIRIGPPLRIAFDPDVLLAALEAAVGPDVLLEVSSPWRPAVVRSADQGSFTTLVMPVHDPAAGRPDAEQ
ncbi:MerR family transcriptional regulator [Streptomyces sp. URMC 123]|uniref:MerR family transcriptional regulator n=1 Tax=Streptomyces sp. URMC 123 TaxID=3423403 RepID=UPI003F1A8210